MRIVVAMSGGVDSSVAAALLVEQSHDVIGLSMQLYDQQQGEVRFGSCCTLDDLHDARRVAHRLGVPHYIVNFERQFDDHVVSNFVREYLAGRTPIPCAHCNSDLKFAALLDRARAFDADCVATGHYARIERGASGRLTLRRGADRAKDQSYFLFSLTQAQLDRARFPVGDLEKSAVRDYARQLALPVAAKPDSHEICFIPDGEYADFVARRAPAASSGGWIVNQDGRALRRHDGIHRFTVGQRKGLGVTGRAPVYVLELRPHSQTVVVGPRAALEKTSLTASGVNWISGEAPETGRRVTAQIRHRHEAAPATVRGADDDCLELEFDTPQTAITPGQAVVVYEGDEVLGGGWIDGP
ncbi:MAG: tRNA 2-thiouridine(34) synthase MnmA [Acidobacteria bacterium]|nr:tRNA 2-thiouridine(34) synthase MnmA [Acidobacteriota bacterium]